MGDTATTDKVKKSWFKGLKGEFKKIIWPDKMTVIRRTTAVVLISILIGAVIQVADLVIRAAYSFLTSVM